MPVLDVTAAVRALAGGGVLRSGAVRVQYWSAPHVAAVTLDGALVTFSPVIEVAITDGTPAAILDVPATDGRCYATVIIESLTGGGRYTSGPVAIPTTATTLEDLIRVDPKTFLPTGETVAAWLVAIAEVTALRDEAAGSAEVAVTSATDSASSATASGVSAATASVQAATATSSAGDAVAARVAAEVARTGAAGSADDAAASAVASAGSVAAVAASATAAAGSATAAGTARVGAETARTNAETARAGSETARAGAEAARDLSLAGQFAGAPIPLGTNLDTMLTPGKFFQSTTAEVTTANGYPLEGSNGRGSLEVTRWAASAGNVIQTYTTIWGSSGGRSVYTRRVLAGNAGAWAESPTQKIDKTAGIAISTWDSIAGRWQLTYGDSGIRDITALLTDVPVTAGSCRIVRKGSIVTLSFEAFTYTGQSSASAADYATLIPSGFKPQFTGRFPMVVSNTSVGCATIYNSGRVTLQPTSAAAQFCQFQFVTQEPWPTGPPGIAVGTIPNL